MVLDRWDSFMSRVSIDADIGGSRSAGVKRVAAGMTFIRSDPMLSFVG